jgi:hypothetical protein
MRIGQYALGEIARVSGVFFFNVACPLHPVEHKGGDGENSSREQKSKSASADPTARIPSENHNESDTTMKEQVPAASRRC